MESITTGYIVILSIIRILRLHVPCNARRYLLRRDEKLSLPTGISIFVRR